ncbi:MAG: peptidoglycan editing factor PgeF [Burkholderiales bacterium]|nr:peptidoglycan editing factor PgeF [Burkholderiales bacterium]
MRKALPFSVIHADLGGLAERVSGFTTTRSGGVSLGCFGDGQGGGGLNLGMHVADCEQSVAINRAKLNCILPSDVMFFSQVHGNIVLNASDISGSATGDAVFAAQPGIVCGVLTADCLPVLLSDKNGKVVAAAHAGWRGLAGGVLKNTVAEMRATGADEIVAWLGPAIGPEKFEVGREVLDAFSDGTGRVPEPYNYFVPRDQRRYPGKYFADIYGLARALLKSENVSQVTGGTRCTVTDEANFYSYRRDGVTGRMASLIWINPS